MKKNNKNKKLITISLFIISITLPLLMTSCGAGGGGGGTIDELCVGNNYENGALQIDNTPSSGTDFSAGLLGTFDRLNSGNIIGGIDWLYTDTGDFSTTSMGTQLISWWTEKGNRNTKMQVTNQSSSQTISVHVQIFNENCLETIDFCDQFTPFDTHIYDFSNIATNTGVVIGSGSLIGEEGFVTVTPNVNCGADRRATSFSLLSGDMSITDTTNGFQYGSKTWSRDADTATSCTESVAGGFKILTGSGDCKLNPVLPSEFSHVFSSDPNSDESRSDLVFISLDDNYSGSGYLATGGSVTLNPIIIDMNENDESCAPRNVCFLRIGVNGAIKDSDDPLPAPASLCDSSAPGAIIGTPGDDTLSGTGGNDVIIGLGGNDTITGGGGADCIDGGPGNDIINAGSGGDTVYGGSGDDNIEGRGGVDTLDGGPGTDNLNGGGGSDTCVNGETLTSC